MKAVLRSCSLLFAFLAFASPSDGGSIQYDFHPQIFPDRSIGSLVVDDAALTRGGITPADVRSFDFPPFALPAMNPIHATIDATTGVSTSDTAFTGSLVNDRVLYSFVVDFGPDAFNRNIMGNYQVSGGNTPGVFGRGWWTVLIDRAAVPEPSSVVMACVALAVVVAVGAARRVSACRG